MFCDIDEAGRILEVCATARASLLEDTQCETHSLALMGRKISSVAYGLLLINNYDVLIIGGSVEVNGSRQEHCWLEVYLGPDLFVLDAAYPLYVEKMGFKATPDCKEKDIVFLPKEETADLYLQGKVQDWDEEDCSPNALQRAAKLLGIKKSLAEIYDEISSI